MWEILRRLNYKVPPGLLELFLLVPEFSDGGKKNISASFRFAYMSLKSGIARFSCNDQLNWLLLKQKWAGQQNLNKERLGIDYLCVLAVQECMLQPLVIWREAWWENSHHHWSQHWHRQGNCQGLGKERYSPAAILCLLQFNALTPEFISRYKKITFCFQVHVN